MAITIKGIRIESLNLEREAQSGKTNIKSASYCLLSSTDCILANQSIGCYSDKIVVTASSETLDLLEKFINSYKKDLTKTLGLEES